MNRLDAMGIAARPLRWVSIDRCTLGLRLHVEVITPKRLSPFRNDFASVSQHKLSVEGFGAHRRLVTALRAGDVDPATTVL